MFHTHIHNTHVLDVSHKYYRRSNQNVLGACACAECMLVAFIKPFTSRRKVSIWPELELRKDNSQFWFLRLVIYNYTIELRFFKRVTICNSQLALNFRFHKSLTCARQIFMGSREGIVSTWWCLETNSARIPNFGKKIFLM